MYRLSKWLYGIATTAIITGVVMLCQPFSVDVFFSGFEVLALGTLLFIILDHTPLASADDDDA
ncbi:MAG: hypothetical protein KDA49_14830 [Rhodospirillaceae bacterium]|nr:hypothetical protein [Rhodospirillaceae bacterium]MCA8933748.1 hypothetical protein [Rhodospirillaceae bacterium]